MNKNIKEIKLTEQGVEIIFWNKEAIFIQNTLLRVMEESFKEKTPYSSNDERTIFFLQDKLLGMMIKHRCGDN